MFEKTCKLWRRVSGGALLGQAIAGDTLMLNMELRDQYLNVITDSNILDRCQVQLELEEVEGTTTVLAQLTTAGTPRQDKLPACYHVFSAALITSVLQGRHGQMK